MSMCGLCDLGGASAAIGTGGGAFPKAEAIADKEFLRGTNSDILENTLNRISDRRLRDKLQEDQE